MAPKKSPRPESPVALDLARRLSRSFYLRPTLTVARDLLGKILVRRLGDDVLAGRIVEVEAYLGAHDPASHAHKGPTDRNRVMFAEGGHLYVYFTYGMHYCANVVTEDEGVGHACLIRALEPLAGIDVMRARRKVKRDVDLTNGPAKLCAAYAIDRSCNGTDLLGDEIFLCDAPRLETARIGTSRRIGISKATTKLWRFFEKGNAFVSR